MYNCLNVTLYFRPDTASIDIGNKTSNDVFGSDDIIAKVDDVDCIVDADKDAYGSSGFRNAAYDVGDDETTSARL